MKKILHLNESDLKTLIIKILDESKKKPNLWDNIRAKRERGEPPARKGSEAYKKAVESAKKIKQKEGIKEEHESNNYMFWQNLETIKHSVEEILNMDRNEVNEILSNGHGWAIDHVSTSADDIEEVYHFLENSEEEVYNESITGRIIHSDEYGFTELLPINEGKGGCDTRGLNKPWLTPDGPKKRSVCVKNDSGNVVKVNFGDPNMRIKKSNPERRKSFRARHKCETPGPKWKARYWSCKFW